MKQHKKNEAGAIMVEILAVLALIGVMGPMLFRQVLDRNKEISNVNMASEMRTIKEAVSAYIAADGAALGHSCLGSAGGSGDTQYCGVISENSLSPFLPAGMDDIMDYYTVKSYAYLIDYGNTGSPDLRPFVYAMVVSNGDGQPQDWNFRRAARVASLIGADGGVVVDNNYTGTSGAWELQVLDRADIQDDSVVATTAFDTFEPDLGIVAPNAVYAPENLAFKKLHAWNYFSVGDKDEKMPGHCFRQVRRMDSDKTLPDEIYGAGASVSGTACDPLFWVGASGDTGDNSEAGHVYAKNNVYVGRDNATSRSAIALETNTTVANGTVNDPLANKERRIVVYDTMGNAKVTIDATGKIIADKTKQADVTVDGGTTMKKSYYGIDAAGTSVLEDVRLGSRGGARLSDILPNYIMKNIFDLSNGDAITEAASLVVSGLGSCTTGSLSKTAGTASVPAQCNIPVPTCPGGYSPAVVVTPTAWKGTQLANLSVPATSIQINAGVGSSYHELYAPAGGGRISGGVQTPYLDMDTSKSATVITIRESRRELKLSASQSGNNFVVKMGYTEDKSLPSWQTSLNLPRGEIKAKAQTFCVFKDTNKAKATDTLDVSLNP